MYHLGFRIFPPGFPTFGEQFFRIGDISDRRIEPDIQHLPFRTFHRHGNPPIKVAAYGTRLQPHIQPTLALSVYVRFPFLMPFQYPLAQERFPFIQRKIPMFGFLHHRLATTDSGFRVDQVRRAQRGTAGFALVAIGFFIAAMRASPGYITVGKELFCFLVVILFARFLDKLSFII